MDYHQFDIEAHNKFKQIPKFRIYATYQDGTENLLFDDDRESVAITMAKSYSKSAANGTVALKNRCGYIIATFIDGVISWENGSMMDHPNWSCVVCGERPCECARISDEDRKRWENQSSKTYFIPTFWIEKPRPSWTEYFIKLAQDVSLRSEDVYVKHGCILVDRKTNHIIGTGYNAMFRGADKGQIDIYDRDARRPYYIHAEENAIMNSTLNPLNLSMGAKAYITGRSCNVCLQRLINFGVVEIVEMDQMGSITDSPEQDKMREKILSMAGGSVTITKIPTPAKS